MEDRAAPLRVGQLGRLAGLSTKALRHYDRIGLFQPAVVDGAGYRWYTSGQVGTARLIGRLRAVDLPLQDVRDCIGASDDEVRAVLLAHRRRLESRLVRLRGALHHLDHLLTDGLETTMGTSGTDTTAGTTTPADERALAVSLFNGVWDLMGTENRSTADDDRMLHMAHASRYHWGQVGAPENLARGEWQCSRVYAVLRRPEPCLHHATRVLELCREHGIGDWDLAFAYEAIARAHAIAGDAALAREFTEQAIAAAADIADDEDRELVLSDLESIPGQPRFW